MTPEECINKALLHMAGLDDGARTRDGTGFNKMDTRIGNSLAQQVASGKKLSIKQLQLAARILKKYQDTQLGFLVLPSPSDFSEAAKKEPKPQEEKVEYDNRVSHRDSVVLVSLDTNDPKFREMLDGIRALSERSYDPNLKTWSVPRRLAPQVLDILHEDVKVPSIVHTWAAQEKATQERWARIKAEEISEAERTGKLKKLSRAIKPTEPQKVEGLGLTPYQWQEVPIEFFRTIKGSFLLFDRMGIGKTLEGLAIARLAKTPDRPILIVCPASLTQNWVDEMAQVTPDIKPFVLFGRSPFPIPNVLPAIICSSSIIAYWADELCKLKPCITIYDECHQFKTMNAERTKAFIQIARHSEINLPMTGTPIENNPEELFPILHAVDNNRWPSMTEFVRRYIEYGWRGQELAADLQTIMVRRSLEDLGDMIPSIKRIGVSVEMSPTGKALYNQRLDEFYQKYEEEGRSPNTLALMESMRQAAALGKFDSCVSWYETFMEATDEKLVIVAHHHEIISKLMDALSPYKPVRILGGMSADEKQNSVRKFQNGDNRLAIISIKAGGLGHTLTAASKIATMEFWWTPTSHEQAEARIHRTGQRNKCLSYSLLGRGTIDEMVYPKLEHKLGLINHSLGESSPNGFGETDSILAEVIDELLMRRWNR